MSGVQPPVDGSACAPLRDTVWDGLHNALEQAITQPNLHPPDPAFAKELVSACSVGRGPQGRKGSPQSELEESLHNSDVLPLQSRRLSTHRHSCSSAIDGCLMGTQFLQITGEKKKTSKNSFCFEMHRDPPATCAGVYAAAPAG